ncbi:MAG: polysaccharide deacetylase family protein, partial [Chitinophagaceae bacterium]
MKHTIVNIIFCSLLVAMGIYAFQYELHFGWLLLTGLLWFLVALAGSSLIFSQYHVKAYTGNSTEKSNRIALTFDDGPSEFTPTVLDMLAAAGIKATFFCIGKNVDRFPEIAARIVKEGHIIANHSYSHGKAFDF